MATNGNGKNGDSSSAPSSGGAAPPPQTVAAQRAGMTQALEELARGERAAAKLENELQAFEARLDSLLTSLGMTETDLEEAEIEAAEEVDKEDTKAGEAKPDEKMASKK